MKKILNILALSSTLVFSGCGDFLEVEPQNIITIDKFWNEEADVESMVAGCYSAMQSYNIISRMMIWGEFRSENIAMTGTSIEKDVNLERVLKENLTAINPYTSWTAFYDVINRCNIIIQFAPKVADNDPAYTVGELNAHIAEVTALRSLCYFYLIRTFRDVPYTEEAYLDDSQKLALPATKFDDILHNLIQSLEAVKDNAVTKYPETTAGSKYFNTGRITKMAIWALLSDLYLWNKDYDNCIKYADLVIDEKKRRAEELDPTANYQITNDYPLSPSRIGLTGNVFGNAFKEIFIDGNSQEGIFEINFERGSEGRLASNGPVSDFYGSSARAGYVKASDYITADIKSSSPKVFTNKYDGRGYENIRFKTGGDADGINKYVCMDLVEFGDPNTSSFYSNGDWGTQYPTFGNNYESRNKSNFIVYRLTDVMLLKAEALALKISDSEAFTDADKTLNEQVFNLVNAINKRSIYQAVLKDTLVATNYTTKAKTIDLVYDERNRELMFEGKRYFDLVRRSQREGNTDYLRSKCKLKSTDNASVVESQLQKMDAIYWPYNLNEIKVNGELIQNSAFGSGENSSFNNSAK